MTVDSAFLYMFNVRFCQPRSTQHQTIKLAQFHESTHGGLPFFSPYHLPRIREKDELLQIWKCCNGSNIAKYDDAAQQRCIEVVVGGVLYISRRFPRVVPHQAGAVSTYADFRGHRMGIEGRSMGHRMGIVSFAKTIVSIVVLRLVSLPGVDSTGPVTSASLSGACESRHRRDVMPTLLRSRQERCATRSVLRFACQPLQELTRRKDLDSLNRSQIEQVVIS